MSVPENTTRLQVRVHPNAARNGITGYSGDVLQIRISAPALRGKANHELVTFLSQRLKINKGSIDIVKGQTNRNKIIAIDGLSRDDILKLLFPAQGSRSV
ncbi:DUF167 domain-containing protein [Chloroflexota bacterium]